MMEVVARGTAAEQLEAADLDHPVAQLGVEAGGLGVQYYLTH